MSKASFTLSAFGDEIVVDLEGQLAVLRDLRVNHLDLRAAWGVGVLAMDDDMVTRARTLCQKYGVSVAAIGSPVGKSPIAEPIQREVANLQRIFRIAEALDTRRVRVFSFYPPKGTPEARYEEYVPEATARLARLAELAGREGFELFLENEKGIVGDSIARCATLLDGVASPHLSFCWDPANFIQVKETAPTEHGWPLLGSRVAHVHIKDSWLGTGAVGVAGEGDGQIPELLTALRDSGYRGFLAVEPHLLIAGHSSGFSGPDGMARAVRTLRSLMARLGCEEVTA